MYYFDHTHYYLFNVNNLSFSKIYSLISLRYECLKTISSRVKLPVQEIGYALYWQQSIE